MPYHVVLVESNKMRTGPKGAGRTWIMRDIRSARNKAAAVTWARELNGPLPWSVKILHVRRDGKTVVVE